MVEKIAIIVSVAHSVEMFEKCLCSIAEGVHQECDIIIVDGIHQTDNIQSILCKYKKHFSFVKYLEQEWNGQAEAFCMGIETALSRKCSHVWLLRDCMQIEKMSLKILVETDKLLGDTYGFLSSCVLCGDELYLKAAPEIRDVDIWSQYQVLEKKIFPIVYASFEGLFLPCRIIKEIGMPILSMKQGYDGYEFTKRIREKHTGYYVIESVCSHSSNWNVGFDIAKEDAKKIKQYKYVYCNDLYRSRKEDFRHFAFYFFRTWRDMFRILKISKKRRIYRIWQIVSGTFLGIIFFPRVEKV